jgi:Pilus biogenesis CpaD protein (pilus_cpaD)
MRLKVRISPILPLLVVTSLALSACDHHTDSIARLNTIPFGGANDANIAVMVANPPDLLRGRGQDSIDGTTAQEPIQRLLTDHPKPLLNPGGNTPGGGSYGSSGGGGGGAGGGSGG